MQRTISLVVVALILVLAGYLYFQSAPHRTVEPVAPTALVTAVPIGGLEKGTGENLAAARADFSGQPWAQDGVKVTPNAAAAPDGSNAAALLAETGGAGRHRILTTVQGTVPEIYTLSVFAKSKERHGVMLEMTDEKNKYGRAIFDLSRKVLVSKFGDVADAGLQALPDGWLRVWAAMPYDRDVIGFNIAIMDPDNPDNPIYSGSNGDGLFIWGVQLEKAKKPGGYHEVAAH